jgi:hypothetical protein
MTPNTRKPKRFLRRCLACFLGLYLGWMAAALAFDQVPQAAYAESPAAHPGEKEGHPHEEGQVHSIEALKVEESFWFGKVVAGAVLLFVAAAVLGPLALSLKGPEPIERDQAHGHDHHDAHTDHSHGHGDKPHGH